MLKVNFTHLFVLLHRKSEFNDIYQLSAGFHFSQSVLISLWYVISLIECDCHVMCNVLICLRSIHISIYIYPDIYPNISFHFSKFNEDSGSWCRLFEDRARWAGGTPTRAQGSSVLAQTSTKELKYKIVGRYLIILITFFLKKTLAA